MMNVFTIKIYKAFLISFLVFQGFSNAFAQQNFLIYNMNFLPQSTYFNSSSLPNERFYLGFPMVSNSSVNVFNSGFKYKDLITRTNDGAYYDFNNVINKLSKENFFLTDVSTDLLSFGLRTKKNYFMFNVTEKVDFRFGYSKQFLDLLWNGNGPTIGETQEFNFALDLSHYREYGLYYARQINSKLNAGVRLKYLYGMENISTNRNTVTLLTDPSTYDITATSNLNINSAGFSVIDYKNLSNYAFKKNNRGWGLDLGADYRITEKIGVSASITNIGFIKWNTDVNNYESKNPESSYTFRGFEMNQVISDSVTSTQVFNTVLDSLQKNFRLTESQESYRINFSPTVFVSGKYYFDEFIYAGLTIQSRKFDSKYRTTASASFNFRLREFFDFGVAYSIGKKSFGNLGVGICYNFGNANLYLLTDNIFGAVDYKNTKFLSGRAGVNFAFGKYFINNDRDDDLIPDKEDGCPYNFGPPETGGCPDTDGDKIIDIEDDCPKEPGVKSLNGCPDRDSDGIMDKYDDCPDIAGEPLFKGCPDRDHDGIMDLDDKCPLEFGTKELKGCPDKDGDGIGDGDDLCPDKKGSESNRGCPDDTDGDGVYDDDDKCPDVAGEKENKGCPNEDSDKDGIFDREDECVYTPGSAQNNGCPLLTTEDLDVINTASEKLTFFENSFEINPSSFVFLENLANWMKNNTYAILSLSSHADNEGPEAGRIQMSKERAISVKQFLINKNVSPLKINYEYFGSSKPIADNNTVEGRKRNNRVEFKIKFK